jgi:hypothetical protein
MLTGCAATDCAWSSGNSGAGKALRARHLRTHNDAFERLLMQAFVFDRCSRSSMGVLQALLASKSGETAIASGSQTLASARYDRTLVSGQSCYERPRETEWHQVRAMGVDSTTQGRETTAASHALICTLNASAHSHTTQIIDHGFVNAVPAGYSAEAGKLAGALPPAAISTRGQLQNMLLISTRWCTSTCQSCPSPAAARCQRRSALAPGSGSESPPSAPRM